MKGITLCGECGFYDWKKHRCKRGAAKETDPKASFYDDCPLPEAEPVRRGEWIETADGGYADAAMRCSACDFQFENWSGLFAYCPVCGAKMDGDSQ